MIYVDTSVALAHILVEDRSPPPTFWNEDLVSSRLLEYELWVRLNSRGLGTSLATAARTLLGCVNMLELSPPVLARALEPFPAPVRALDALHLSSLQFLRAQGQDVALASYDERLNTAARRLGVKVMSLKQ